MQRCATITEHARYAAATLILGNVATVTGKEVKSIMPMTEAAKEARRAYRKKWYEANKEKQREYERRFWERKAAKKRQEAEKTGKTK